MELLLCGKRVSDFETQDGKSIKGYTLFFCAKSYRDTVGYDSFNNYFVAESSPVYDLCSSLSVGHVYKVDFGINFKSGKATVTSISDK